jgi:hypothetical protein
MIPVLAHHLEFHHVPILVAIFAVGYWVGWHNIGKFLKR